MDKFAKACLKETKDLIRTVISYDDEVELKVDEPQRFTLSITDAREVTPPQKPGQVQQELFVQCTVEARLVTPDGALSVSPEGWNEQKFVAKERTWTWVVTASAVGRKDALLQLRPVVLRRGPDGTLNSSTMGTEEFPVTFNVDRTVGQIASSVWKFLLAAAAGAVTLIGAYLAIGRLRRPQAPVTVDEESADDETG